MTRLAVTFALVAMAAWGIWAVLANLATRTIAPTTAMIVSYATSVGIALAYVAYGNRELSLVPEGTGFALAAGVFAGIGAVAFYSGLEAGRTAVVTTVSALYFVVAALIGIALLGESIGGREVAGIVFAVLAVILLAR